MASLPISCGICKLTVENPTFDLELAHNISLSRAVISTLPLFDLNMVRDRAGRLGLSGLGEVLGRHAGAAIVHAR